MKGRCASVFVDRVSGRTVARGGREWTDEGNVIDDVVLWGCIFYCSGAMFHPLLGCMGMDVDVNVIVIKR